MQTLTLVSIEYQVKQTLEAVHHQRPFVLFLPDVKSELDGNENTET